MDDPGQNDNSLHISPVLSVLVLSSSGIKLKACAIEMLMEIHQFLSNSYTTTIMPTLRCTLITPEMNSSSNLQTCDDVLHAETVSEDEPEKGIEAHHKHC
jgi:hypothetical protein